MPQHLKASLLCAIMAVVFLTLQIAVGLQTGTAGVFVMGVAGGFLVSNQLKPAPKQPAV